MKRFLPDINVLVYAHREEAPQHQVASDWLQSVLNAGHGLVVYDLMLASFYRIVTNRRIYDPASSIEDAIAFANGLIASPNTELIAVPQVWDGFEKLSRELRLVGADSSDVFLAAVAIALDLELVSFDKGFSRFAELRLSMLCVPGEESHAH